jgi:CubicO group peptidase (beta-lactamase class C family)
MPSSSLLRRSFIAGSSAFLTGLGASGVGRAAVPRVSLLNAELERLRQQYRLPGVAALVLRAGRTAAQGVAGLRSNTAPGRIRLNDPFLIGSCGKSMTATIVARLVQEGALAFESTLEELLPELRFLMRHDYRDVSLADLLAHRGGIPQLLPLPLPLGGNPADLRAVALPVILALPPQGEPGQTYLYSNLGYIVVGAVLDRVAGIPFERLAARELFRPLGLGSAGFFAPTGSQAPRGHTFNGIPLPPSSPLYVPRAASPAGLFHLSLPNWAKYARLHLGLGPRGYLPPALLARLQRPFPGPGESYALGWHVDSTSHGTVLRHDGSEGYWSARIVLIPSRDYAILMATNILSPGAERAAHDLEASLLRQFPP